ncbi:PAS domain-containing protein [Hyphomonas sp.]|uniref:PAS domain-containing protein n=1 Tax=Hyphomonas sp. TaxID=87 RepID=UPI00391C093A
MWEREVFFDRHPDPMWICDPETLGFLDVNAAALAAYGYTREEFLGLKAPQLWPAEDLAAFQSCLDAARGNDMCRAGTFRHQRRSGEILQVELTISRIDWQGRPAVIVAARDVTRTMDLVREREVLLRREEGVRQAAESLAEKLSEQVSTLRTAQRLIGIGAWKYEYGSGRLNWSPEFYRIYGLDEASYTPTFEGFASLVHPDDRDEVVETYRNFAGSGQTEFDLFHRICRPDGRIVHIRSIGELSGGPQGRMLTGIIQDVTLQVEQDNRLRLLDLSISRLNDAVLIFEARSGDDAVKAPVVYINGGATRVSGLRESEIVGHSIEALVRVIARGIAVEVLRTVLNAGESRREEIRLFTPEGKVMPAEIDLVPVRDAAGRMSHWVAVVRDMSEKRAADARARLNEERYQMLSRSTNDVVWDFDVLSGLVTWNENFRRLAGAPDSLLVDQLTSWTDRLHPEDRDRVLATFWGAIRGDAETWTDEYRFLRDDGDVRFVLDRGFISRDETGGPLRIVGSMVDITQQKIAEARLVQAEKLDALGQMTGGVAHDFNNLLTIIFGNAETLLDRIDTPRERRLVELISSAAERGRDLTGRLLAFARRLPLKPQIIDLNLHLQRSAELMRRTFRSNVRIEMDLGEPAAFVEADPGQLELAVLNLALNARHAMREGGVLTLATRHVPAGSVAPGFEKAQPADADRVMLIVSDTGTGMDAETLRRCLEPFFTTKPVGEGVGLGLSMAYGFMAQSGGQLLIDSHPGFGTTVGLIFPVSSESLTENAPGHIRGGVRGGSEHVLLVEDNPAVRDNAEAILTGLGYRVTALGTADEAIGYIQNGGAADLLLTDIMMPGSADVRDLVALARSLLPGMRVLYVSGYPRELLDADGRLPARMDLLQKPYRRSELAAAVRQALDAAAASVEPQASEA